MIKLLFLMPLLAVIACNSNPGSSKDSTTAKTDSAGKTFAWPQQEEQEFMLGCVDSAKLKIGEAAAYTRCKCILGQLKQRFPNMDSAAPALMDVNKVAELAAKCE